MLHVNHSFIEYLQKYFVDVKTIGEFLNLISFPNHLIQKLDQNDICYNVICTRKPIDFNRIKIIHSRSQGSLNSFIFKTLNETYKIPIVCRNWLKKEEVYSYLINSVLKHILIYLSDETITYILHHFYFFEYKNQYILQRSGPYFSILVWKTQQSPSTNVTEVANSQQSSYTDFCNEKCKESNILQIDSRIKMLHFKHGKKFFNSYLVVDSKALFNEIFKSLETNIKLKLNENVLSLLDQIILRQKKCKFDFLLKNCCPHNNSDSTPLSFATPHKSVCRFIHKVFFYIFPIELFASKKNKKAIYQGLTFLVTMSIKVNLNIHHIRGNTIDLNLCSWMDNLQCNHRKSKTFDHLIVWVVKYFITLLSNKFYITHSQNHQLHFFRYDIYDSIKSKCINALVKDVFEPSCLQEYVETSRNECSLLNLSSLRFLPTHSKWRLLNKIETSEYKYEVQEIFRVLNFFISSMIEMPKSKRYHNNISLIQDALMFDKQLFFIRVDIANCYPSIDQKKLFSIICERLNGLKCSSGLMKFKTIDAIDISSNRRRVQRYSIETREFNTFVAKILSKKENCIIVPKMSTNDYLLSDVKTFFRNYIVCPFVKVGKKSIYRMVKGIRQGGPISSGLCSIYIDHMLEEVIGDFGKLQGEWRVLHEDDMCFITVSLERAKFFLHKMLDDFPKFGLHINLKKLQINFDPSIKVDTNVSDFFLYYGRHIYPNLKKVVVNYENYREKPIRYTFFCDPFMDKNKICKNIIAQIDLTMFSWELNSKINEDNIVALNIYERSRLQAMRLSCYLLLSPKYKSKQNPKFVCRFIIDLAKKIINITKKWINKIQFKLNLDEIKWITAKATQKHWQNKKTRHRKQEVNGINFFIDRISARIDKEKIDQWALYFDNNCSKVFNDMQLI